MAENQELLNKFRVCDSLFLSHMAWSDTVLASTDFKSIRFWNIYDGSLFKEIPTTESPERIEFYPNGKKIIWCRHWYGAEILDIDSSQRISLLKSGYERYNTLLSSSLENFAISLCNKNVRFFNLEIQKWLGNIIWIGDYEYMTQSFCGKFLISCKQKKLINVWYLGDLENIRKDKEIFHDYELTSISWSPDSKSIIAGDKRGSIIVWDYDTGKEVKKIKAYKTEVLSINISKNGHLISCGDQAAIKLWKFNSFY